MTFAGSTKSVAALHDLLGDDATLTEAVEIIRSLADRVTFKPTTDGGLEIELIGDLAKMVCLAQNSIENGPYLNALARFAKQLLDEIVGWQHYRANAPTVSNRNRMDVRVNFPAN